MVWSWVRTSWVAEIYQSRNPMLNSEQGFVPPRPASTADHKHPCAEDIIIEADEACAIQGQFAANC